MSCLVVIPFSVFAGLVFWRTFLCVMLSGQPVLYMLLVRIIVVNIIMIDINANMGDSKESGGNVRPD
jgi:hypothetical protein